MLAQLGDRAEAHRPVRKLGLDRAVRVKHIGHAVDDSGFEDSGCARFLARGIAPMMRAGLYPPVHVKTLRSQKLPMLLTHRKLLQSKAIAIENDLRGTLRDFGLKVGMVGKVKFEARIRELVETSRPGGAGRADAHCSAGATRTDRHPASPFAGHCPG
jgi:hypothetical protein